MSHLFSRRHEETAKHDRWMVSWADFVTLLFACFLALYAMVPKELHQQLWNQLQPARTEQGSPADIRLEAALLQALQPFVLEHQVTIHRTSEGLLLHIPDTALFASGTAELDARALGLLSGLANVLKDVPNPVRVEGHTDDQAIHTPAYPSNWELSAARASRVVRWLAQEHVTPSRLSAVGYGPTRPLASNDNDTGRARNRRVAIVILTHQDHS